MMYYQHYHRHLLDCHLTRMIENGSVKVAPRCIRNMTGGGHDQSAERTGKRTREQTGPMSLFYLLLQPCFSGERINTNTTPLFISLKTSC